MTLTDADTARARAPWRAWAWVVLGLLVLGEATAVVMVDWFTWFGQSSTCGDAPTPGQMRTGRLGLAGVLVAAALPWLVAAALHRERALRLLVAGAVVAVPAVLFVVSGLSADFWVGNFCF
jgi:hypothetical protein